MIYVILILLIGFLVYQFKGRKSTSIKSSSPRAKSLSSEMIMHEILDRLSEPQFLTSIYDHAKVSTKLNGTEAEQLVTDLLKSGFNPQKVKLWPKHHGMVTTENLGAENLMVLNKLKLITPDRSQEVWSGNLFKKSEIQSYLEKHGTPLGATVKKDDLISALSQQNLIEAFLDANAARLPNILQPQYLALFEDLSTVLHLGVSKIARDRLGSML